MTYIKGRVRQLIYEGSNGYKIGLFKVKDTDDAEVQDFLNRTITFTGTFMDLNFDDYYEFNGHYGYHERYGHQFIVSSYNRILPDSKDALVEFLTSDLIKGCGLKTAYKIVDKLGLDALNKIKENPNVLLSIDGLSEKKASKIYESILAYSSVDETVLKLQEYGFSIKEATTLINNYSDKILDIVKEDIYSLVEDVTFNKLDKIYLDKLNNNLDLRSKACIIEALKRMEFNSGSTYQEFAKLNLFVNDEFDLNMDDVALDNYLEELINDGLVINDNNHYYLEKTFEDERYIAHALHDISSYHLKIANYSDIKDLEDSLGIKYNEEQQNAIVSSLNNSITIISGGPGVGKTTIVDAIVKLYIKNLGLNNEQILSDIALLAPTGRAAKRMSEKTNLPATTIHRFLKWNKENNEFSVNEYNKNYHKLVIVDEMSMIDNALFASLLKGLTNHITLVLVGDYFQLPSVGAGNVLRDLILSNKFNYCPLTMIYRQTNNSYIPILASEIKDHNLELDFKTQRDDYNFIETKNYQIKSTLKKVIDIAKEKGYNENDIQVLAPLYKGENGIDNLNIMLRDIFNPEVKNELKFNDVIYKEDDKVLQLVNDPDNNVYNGDIGYIKHIDLVKKEVTINFLGNYIIYKKDELVNIKHAYAISIHKSQGSEFNFVIIPISHSYSRMLYNKLLYTAVSRGKKSIIMIGEGDAFLNAISNDYASNRNTGLISFLEVYFK
ncbi:MAG: ATP-dependent RecD-like DNA helicase [Bacilli bacterium]|nr:ATP-dependent RecD-like DNA helicase [Bacilli bacterium]